MTILGTHNNKIFVELDSLISKHTDRRKLPFANERFHHSISEISVWLHENTRRVYCLIHLHVFLTDFLRKRVVFRLIVPKLRDHVIPPIDYLF